jgi:hypothetical protein
MLNSSSLRETASTPFARRGARLRRADIEVIIARRDRRLWLERK